MISGNTFRIQIIWRILLLALLITGLLYLAINTNRLFYSIALGVAVVVSITELILHVEKAGREAALFQPSVKKKRSSTLSKEKQYDLASSLQMIEKSSIDLLNFVNDYRSLKQIPSPDLKEVMAEDLFENIKRLKAGALFDRGIDLRMTVTGFVTINCDPELIGQVLINLINNAEEALHGVAYPVIELSADIQNSKAIIRVKDNGKGMDPETQKKIFVPFFTTKRTGSGIGLSLSRQIMLMHSGSISVGSIPGTGSAFSLVF